MAWVTDPTNELVLHFVDLRGVKATLQFWIDASEVDPEGGSAAALAAGAQGLSNNYVDEVEILRRAHETTPGTPTDGPYARAADKAKLLFNTADGATVKMQIPSPNETIFDSGAFDVDPADAAMAAFIAYVKTNCLSEDGSVITALAKGYRTRPPRRKHQ